MGNVQRVVTTSGTEMEIMSNEELKETENIQLGGGDDRTGMVAKFKYFVRLSSGNEISHFHKRSIGKNQRKRKAVTYHLISIQGRSCLVRDYLLGMSEKSLYIRKAVEKQAFQVHTKIM